MLVRCGKQLPACLASMWSLLMLTTNCRGHFEFYLNTALVLLLFDNSSSDYSSWRIFLIFFFYIFKSFQKKKNAIKSLRVELQLWDARLLMRKKKKYKTQYLIWFAALFLIFGCWLSRKLLEANKLFFFQSQKSALKKKTKKNSYANNRKKNTTGTHTLKEIHSTSFIGKRK